MQTIQEAEADLIVDRILVCKGNMSYAAKTLDISRAALYNKARRYGVDLNEIRKDIFQAKADGN